MLDWLAAWLLALAWMMMMMDGEREKKRVRLWPAGRWARSWVVCVGGK